MWFVSFFMPNNYKNSIVLRAIRISVLVLLELKSRLRTRGVEQHPPVVRDKTHKSPQVL